MSDLLPDHDYRTLWHVACKDLEQLYDELQDKNGQINRLKHELQSVEYALSDERINNTMGAADVAHEMRCELDTLRAELDALKFAAVPDAKQLSDHSAAYVVGWNECRAAMLAAPNPAYKATAAWPTYLTRQNGWKTCAGIRENGNER